MRQLHGEFVPLRLWPPAPIARCLAVPEVDGNRVARRRPNNGPRLSKRRWQQTCRDREELRCFRSWGLTGRSAYMFVATQMTAEDIHERRPHAASVQVGWATSSRPMLSPPTVT